MPEEIDTESQVQTLNEAMCSSFFWKCLWKIYELISSPSIIDNYQIKMESFSLVCQLVSEKENTDFKPVVFCLRILPCLECCPWLRGWVNTHTYIRIHILIHTHMCTNTHTLGWPSQLGLQNTPTASLQMGKIHPTCVQDMTLKNLMVRLQ